MIALMHWTQLSIVIFTASVAKCLWNVYATVRRDGHIPARLKRRYEREFYFMAGFAVIAGLMSSAAIIAYTLMVAR